MPQKIAQKSFFWLFCKMCEFWVPRGGGLSPFFHSVFDGAPFGPQGCPRAAPGLLFHLFWHGFVHMLSPRDAFLKVLGSVCVPHTVQNQAEFRVTNFPGNPQNINAIAVPSERCTDDVNNQAEYRAKNFPGNPEEKTR